MVTIGRPDVVALIEAASERLTGGSKTEAVALAMRCLLGRSARTGTLFGYQPDSVRLRAGVDLTEPLFDDPLDAEPGREFER